MKLSKNWTPASIPDLLSDSSITLRRESDNTEKSFPSANDTIVIATWLAGSVGYITRWGSLLSSVPSQQPRWIPAG